MNNPYQVEVVGKDERNRKIYGVTYKEKNYHHIGFPDSWGTYSHAKKYMAECLLFISVKEYEAAHKAGRI